jgi:small subunit ribosomal protein S6
MTYELTILLTDETEFDNIKKLITEHAGKVTKEVALGKKTLAYAIKKQRAAYFFTWTIDMPQNQVTEFRKKLNFNEKILRYLLLIGS